MTLPADREGGMLVSSTVTRETMHPVMFCAYREKWSRERRTRGQGEIRRSQIRPDRTQLPS